MHSMDRLARNLDDLRALVQALTRKGVRVEFDKESLGFTGEDSPWPTSCSSSWAPSPNSSAPSSGNGKGKEWPLAKQRGLRQTLIKVPYRLVPAGKGLFQVKAGIEPAEQRPLRTDGGSEPKIC